MIWQIDEKHSKYIQLQIAYSTQRYVLFRPRKTDMKSVPMQAHRFLGHVLIESNVWSTAGVVRISCVLLIPQRKQVCLERGNHIDRPFGQRNESTVTKYVSLLESPFSSKLAYQDIPIYPMASCSLWEYIFAFFVFRIYFDVIWFNMKEEWRLFDWTFVWSKMWFDLRIKLL